MSHLLIWWFDSTLSGKFKSKFVMKNKYQITGVRLFMLMEEGTL
jgi:hypothetical protein